MRISELSKADRRALTASEEQIHRAVVAQLHATALHTVFWSHVPAGELRDKAIGAKLVGLGLRAGIPDIMLVIGGHAHFLELKREGGRLSNAQCTAQAELRLAGATVATVYGVDEAMAKLKEWGALR